VSLTTHSGGDAGFFAMPIEELVCLIHASRLEVPVSHVFRMDQIMEAHLLSEENGAARRNDVLT